MSRIAPLSIFLLLLTAGGSFAFPSAVSLTPSSLTVGHSTDGVGFLNINNLGAGEDLVLAHGKHLTCQKNVTTRQPNEWIIVEAVWNISPDINPFPLCVWPKGQYNDKSCATVTYDREYTSGDPWPTDDWVDYVAISERCIDGEALYIPLVTK